VELLVCFSDLFGVSLDFLVLGTSNHDLSNEANVTRIKSNIDELVSSWNVLRTLCERLCQPDIKYANLALKKQNSVSYNNAKANALPFNKSSPP
jgi:hypothetical protein